MRVYYSMLFRHEGKLYLGDLNEHGYVESFADLTIPEAHLEHYEDDAFYYVYIRESDDENLTIDKITKYDLSQSHLEKISVGNIEPEMILELANTILSGIRMRRSH